jgi:mannose-6-phosphate isomerase-like protein (cupin superfamily)
MEVINTAEESSVTCEMCVDHVGRTWRHDLHQTDELFMLLAGELELEIRGECVKPKIGEESLIPAHVPHLIRNIGGKTTRWLYSIRN